MSAALAALVGILFVELLIQTGFVGTAYALLATSRKSTRVMTSRRISDHWKEKALLRYSRTMMVSTLRLALVLAVAGLGVWGIAFAAERLAGIDLFGFLATWQGLALSTAVAMAYAAVFRRGAIGGGQSATEQASAASEYSASDKLLHRLALSSPAVREMTLDLELAAGGKATTERTVEDRHVFVAGLARAGTTILMRSLYASGCYRSLTYRDMPFVLAPNLWRRIANIGARDKAAQERAHGDGIAVDYDSPEALEEVFWKTFCGDDYIHADHVGPHAPDAEVIDKFRDYVDAILRSADGAEPPAYLSKNNNSILRLPGIREAFPNSTIVIPFRDPLQQAISLRSQHRRFIADNEADPFAGRYMAWLAHYEFGANHLPFCFDTDELPELTRHDPDTLDYWLACWAHVYRHVMARAPADALFLSYERLCDPESGAWPALVSRLDLARRWPGASEQVFRLSRKDAGEQPDPRLSADAEAVHRELLTRSL